LDFILVLLEVGDDGFSDDTTNLINHEHRNQIDSQQLDVHLVDSNVEQVQLEVGEFKDKSLDEDRVVVGALGLVILHVGCVNGHLAEVLIHDHGHDGLSNGDNHVNVTLWVTVISWVSQVGQFRNVKGSSVMIWSNDSSCVEECDNDEAADTPAWEADDETNDVLLNLL
jgi:hypothetical protein